MMTDLNQHFVRTTYRISREWLEKNIDKVVECSDVEFYQVLTMFYEYIYSDAAMDHFNISDKIHFYTEMDLMRKAGRWFSYRFDYIYRYREAVMTKWVGLPISIIVGTPEFKWLKDNRHIMLEIIDLTEVPISTSEAKIIKDDRLSECQKKIARFIFQYNNTHGTAPSYREIMKESGLHSTSSINYNIQKLLDFGVIRKVEGKGRNLKLADVMS